MIAVIADDFTGAAEIAGLGWRHGLRADLLARGEPPSEADLVVYDSDSRNCPAAEARRRVNRIIKQLGTRKPDWIFKKVDSVLRGNVIAEIEAALAALRLKRCLLAPANPNAGRTIRGGKYYIRGTPIHRSDFRNDPRHPRLSARIVDLLGRPKSSSLALLGAKTKALREGINVGEATKFEDVQHWANLADEQTLAVGGADFFQALLLKHLNRSSGLRCGAMAAPAETRQVGGRRSRHVPGTLFVCGSLTESALKFLAECRAKGWPVLLMPGEMLAGGKQFLQGGARCSVRGGVAIAKAGAHATAPGLSRSVRNWKQQIVRALRKHPKVVVGIGRPLLPGRQTPARLGKSLADTVRQVLRAARPGTVCVEGGATAALLFERMGWRRSSVEVEFTTGVTGARPYQSPGMLIVCKPGSYPWPDKIIGRTKLCFTCSKCWSSVCK